ncbi:hypothetical protein PMG71_04970 [Roseofilum sp. BLCC_M154]|uniref:Type II secretion system protein GspC N-terminal domain-containing protein n=1 Tax=Roseofilum acuticapitatum BLCC-M154 TaxID=3022444 RepID=A0ABT7AQQ9_9CYAN|nr:hypothetical protein [Roseofilum acuticapitatum]MDJ1168769.1 hypothetical protein [Roseofilum acuticapitatum BLCC-M154]
MDQDVYKPDRESDLHTDSIHMASWSMEQEVNGLMDDLFDDIDRVLDRGGALPKEPVQPESISLKPLDIPSMKLPQAIAENLAQISPELASLTGIAQTNREMNTLKTVEQSQMAAPTSETSEIESAGFGVDLQPTVLPEEELFPVTAPAPRVQPWWDRLLLVGVGAAIALPLGWWISSTQTGQGIRQQFAQFLPSSQPSPEPMAPVDVSSTALADEEFANYMQRALKLKDELSENQEDQPQDASETPLPESPPSTPTQVLERVYIPVYQPTPAPVASPEVPAASPSAMEDEVVPSPLPSPTPQSVANTPQISLMLTGILELGDRSAALFEIEGMSRRFQVGETIGSSGWMLVDIVNQEAIIRRNGEVRSVFVGQKF